MTKYVLIKCVILSETQNKVPSGSQIFEAVTVNQQRTERGIYCLVLCTYNVTQKLIFTDTHAHIIHQNYYYLKKCIGTRF